MDYQSSNNHERHLVFVGRWVTFHDGHQWIIKNKYLEKKKQFPVLILIRDTDYDEIPAKDRISPIVAWLMTEEIHGAILIIPDIEGVYFGRKVGYQVQEIEAPPTIQKVSGTTIRKSWNTSVNINKHEQSSSMVEVQPRLWKDAKSIFERVAELQQQERRNKKIMYNPSRLTMKEEYSDDYSLIKSDNPKIAFSKFRKK